MLADHTRTARRAGETFNLTVDGLLPKVLEMQTCSSLVMQAMMIQMNVRSWPASQRMGRFRNMVAFLCNHDKGDDKCYMVVPRPGEYCAQHREQAPSLCEMAYYRYVPEESNELEDDFRTVIIKEPAKYEWVNGHGVNHREQTLASLIPGNASANDVRVANFYLDRDDLTWAEKVQGINQSVECEPLMDTPPLTPV